MIDVFRFLFNPSIDISDKIAIVALLVFAVVICILQVIIANKNKEIQRLRKERDSLAIAMTTKQLAKESEKTAKQS
jgi:hypothetical protein